MEDRYASQQRIGGVALSELKFVPSERRKNAAILAALLACQIFSN